MTIEKRDVAWGGPPVFPHRCSALEIPGDVLSLNAVTELEKRDVARDGPSVFPHRCSALEISGDVLSLKAVAELKKKRDVA